MRKDRLEDFSVTSTNLLHCDGRSTVATGSVHAELIL